jgi:transposase
VYPGNHESAGKQKSGRARKGNVHLRTILVGAATSASRTKVGYLKDKYHRLKTRRGALWGNHGSDVCLGMMGPI